MQIPLSKLTTFQDNGSVLVTQITSVTQLGDLLKNHRNYGIIVGAGSNLLINPLTTKTLFKLDAELTNSVIEHEYVQVSAGMHGSKLLATCQENQLGGLEFIAGTPTSVGGMVAMNFGSFGQEISSYVFKIRAMDKQGQDRWYLPNELNFQYRSSIFLQQELIILEVLFKLKCVETAQSKKLSQEYIAIRKQKQPLGQRTFGSIFKNPPNAFAGQILESCGYKGKVYKNMQIFEKHANFLVNLGQAQFQDICAFLTLIKNDIFNQTKINLETEVRIID